MQEARLTQDRRANCKTLLDTAERDAAMLMSSLQPMIQEHHAGWQRLLGQQKKLDVDRHKLVGRLDETRLSAGTEVSTRTALSGRIQETIQKLQNLQSFLDRVGGTPPSASVTASAS